MNNIKNIIFDFGGVLLNIDYALTEKAFIQLGVHNFSTLYNQHKASDLFEQLETGKITPNDFYTIFRNISNTQLSNEQIKKAWNAMLLNLPKERVQYLADIRNRYNIFLYSNTNQIHYDCFIQTANNAMPNNNFNSLFIQAYYSHICGFRKPYIESYTNILQEQQLNPSETLFIDDTLINIQGAANAGLQVLHLQYPNTILNLLEEL
ncbi:MAG: HAD family phosphatase [Chitinophagaceae bacterium]|nr:HAD family phosphatase [Chitinophagaceae bacterium]MCW5904512.1 HAD family phosphatase [Chitinophagaceae bacterium]